MLQAAMVVTGSGLVAFTQHFTAKPHAPALGGLIKTVAALAQVTTGQPLEVLEYERAVVVIASRAAPASTPSAASASATCALILDRGAGPLPAGTLLYGRTLARLLLARFWDSHGRELLEGAGAHAVGRFKAFGARIPVIAVDAARAALRQRKCPHSAALALSRMPELPYSPITLCAVGERNSVVCSALLVFDDAAREPAEACQFRGDSGGRSGDVAAQASALHAFVAAANDLRG